MFCLDLKYGSASTVCNEKTSGSEFQSSRAGRLNALHPMVTRKAGGTVRWTEEEDLRVWTGVM